MNYNKTMAWLGSIALIMSLVIAVQSGYAYFFAAPALSYANWPFPVVSKGPIRAGDVVPLEVVRCNNSKELLTYGVTRTLQNMEQTKTFLLEGPAVQQTALDPGCNKAVSLFNRLPKDTPPGLYRIFGTGTIKGQSRDYHVVWYSMPFTVSE